MPRSRPRSWGADVRFMTEHRRRVRRWAGVVMGSALTALILVHVPPVREWLASRGQRGGAACPFGYGGGAAITRLGPARTRTAAVHSETLAPERSALGFALGSTTAADLARWAAG